MDNPSAREVYEFDDFRLDAGHLMLYHKDEELTLAPKAVETLLALVKRRGEIVSKDELLEAVWPDAVVEESNLFLYLSVLRKTLGTQKNGKPWVETLRRRGYRFSENVRLVPAANGDGTPATKPVPLHIVPAPSPDKGETPDVRPSPRSFKRWGFAVVGLIAVVVVLGFSYSYFFTSRQIKSIAVMPFVNTGGDAELEYIPDGMTDKLIGSLRRIPGLQVKASSTMSRYKGTALDAAAVGRELDVQTVLSPRMVQRGDELELYLELVDTQTENSLWQRTYNRKLSQLGLLERDITRDLVSELRLDLTGSTTRKLAKNYTENADANRLYHQGVFKTRRLSEPEIRQGIAYLWQAIEHDPSYAPAYAMIANGYRTLSLCCDDQPSELLRGRAAAEKAVELDPELAEAHSALAGSLYLHDWNFAEAEKHFLRALELDPEIAISHFQYGDFLVRMGRPEEAKTHKAYAIELEPLSPFIRAFTAFDDDPDKQLEKARFAIELDPNIYMAHLAAASAYRAKKMYAEALAEFRRAKEVAPEQTWSDAMHAGTLKEMEKIDEVRAMLDEMLRRSRSHYVPPFHIAMVYNHLGDTEQTLAWLEKGYQVRDPKMTFVKTQFRKLHSDPQYQDLMRRVGF